uniref:Uncharacterized protein n=1 Tax=Chromera velia CCMP2878 TaxID=1169474 RepID=A0A0G4FA46_9ALVE|eukprot:Cvel_15823.t1-p1 / transcript=Cvel_15823.t1 / gene=Cvel_15823 / organism=Chromera_velia_CCMP2878 / gene_product=Ankyrin repeat domain-containing protein 29, putative / transcript_product=Ankyrin repeat domain-containing protein 29, putative / location=Cvel_scaffold1189:12506-14743(+) / protein_length=746 / sequence_SO=supercontig / SO=protein_coding / is_pseudo=false
MTNLKSSLDPRRAPAEVLVSSVNTPTASPCSPKSGSSAPSPGVGRRVLATVAVEKGSPLLEAAGTGDFETVGLLLRSGTQGGVDEKDRRGNTALMAAAMNGHTETVGRLLGFGANIEERCHLYGNTALILAALSGHAETVDFLLHSGARAGEKNKNGNNALFMAARDGHTETVDVLLRSGVQLPGNCDNNGNTALMFAAMHGHTETADLLLSSGARVDDANSNGDTALMVAARDGHTETVSLLLSSLSADQLEQTNKEGSTALTMAAQNGHTETVALLLQKKADVAGSLERERERAKSVASKRGHTEVVNLLEGRTEAEGSLTKGEGDWVKRQRESWEPIADVLRGGAVVLWPLPALQLLLSRNEKIPKRQEVEETLRRLGWSDKEAAGMTELRKKLEEAEFPSRSGLTVVCLSYPWLSREHPDPECFHLQKLCEQLSSKWWARGEAAAKVAVFWDFMSLFQKPRDERQDSLFKTALENLDLLYSSTHTRVCRSTAVSPLSLNPLSFNERGWPTFETFITGFKPPNLIHLISMDSNASSVLLTPACPKTFDKILNTKIFTNGADAEIVKALYRGFVSRTAGTIRAFSFAGRREFSDESADSLTSLLRFMREEALIAAAVTQCDLSYTSVSHAAVVKLLGELGKVHRLKRLLLKRMAGTAALKALRESFEDGEMSELNFLDLRDSRGVDGSCVSDLEVICKESQKRKKKRLDVKLMRTPLARNTAAKEQLQDKEFAREFVDLELQFE